jgi:hypothetical protein
MAANGEGRAPTLKWPRRSRVTVYGALTLALWTLSSLAGGKVVAGDAGAGCRRTLVLWAWERSEDLRFLDAQCTAVAWFAGQVDIEAEALRFTPRQQGLRIQPHEANWPVLRADAYGPPPVREKDRLRREEFVRNVRRFITSDRLTRGLQVDFDAPRSWRPFYTKLLGDLRSALPTGTPLTMTALASWCLGDPWIREAPVGEAVPMLFRMGPDGPNIRRAVASSGTFTVRACRGSVGISLDELMPPRIARSATRVYVFAPRPWTPDLVARAYELAGMSRGPAEEQQ